MNCTQYFKRLVFLLFLYTVSLTVKGQCTINLTGVPCVGNSLTFSHSASGASGVEWNFNNEGLSSQSSSAFVFTAAGFKTVYLRVNFPSAPPCFDTLTFEVFPLPEIRSTRVSPDSQCMTGNQYCFIDSSAVGNCLTSIRYLFDDGELITRPSPTGVENFCKNFSGTSDMVMNYTIEVVSCNGCVRTFRPSGPLVITMPGQVSFTSNYPNGCDTVTGHFVNTSQINPANVERFVWSFGDGTRDSVNWGAGGIAHLYTTRGPVNDGFSVSLKVWQKGGCVQEFTLSNAVINTLSPTGIQGVDTFYCAQDLLTPSPAGNIPPGMTFTWRMTGAGNVPWVYANEQSPSVRIENLGPHRLVLETSHSTCKRQEFSDTFFVIGPWVKIEEIDSGYLIEQNQRYQCNSRDTVYFPNRTRYYHNDQNTFNDDSSVLLPKGVRHWVFDANLNPLSSKRTERKDDNIVRIWDFGDAFASQCTTNTALGINVGRNCNFSMDRYPKHFYTPWDTVYKDSFYLPNISFVYLDFLPNGDCHIRMVDTTEAELHRTLFFRRIPDCFEVTLTETDTLHSIPCVGTDKIKLAIQKVDITNTQVEGQGCLTQAGTNIQLRARFDKAKPRCSFNMMLFNPNVTGDSGNWLPYIAEPPDNSYEFTGMFSPTVGYSYDSSVYNMTDDTLTVGFIVANGVFPNICYDTLFIKNPFKIERAQSFFEIVNPGKELKKVCVGDTVVFGENNLAPLFAEAAKQIQWTVLRPNDNDPAIMESVGYVSETRHYGQAHPHPDSSHLFVDILTVINTLTNPVILDTVILNEIYDYDIVMEITDYANMLLQQQWFILGLPTEEYTKERAVKMFWNGEGAFGNPATGAKGCLDTTGLTSFMKFNIISRPNGKRILHYRDTSVLPLLNHTVSGIPYDNTYSFVPKQNGSYTVNLMVMNSVNCMANSQHRFVVGFSAKAELSDSVFCSEEDLELKPVFRYYRVGKNTGDLDSTDYWEIRKEDAGKPGFEGITKVDWSKEDDDTGNPNTIFGTAPYGVEGYDSAYILGGLGDNKLYYQEPGKYTLRIMTSDSTGCADTLSQNVYVLDNHAKFSLNIHDLNCQTIIELFDSSRLTDIYDSLFGKPAHGLHRWKIDWGDGSENIFSPLLPPQIGHQYKGFGVFNVQMITSTKGTENQRDPMCADTFELELNIPGPQPYFEELSPLVICLGDSVVFANKSLNPTQYAQFIWNLGDSTFITSQGGDTVVHQYKEAGVYSVFLLQSDSLPGTIHYCSDMYPDTPSQQAIKVIVLDFFDATITQDKYSICVGDSVTFTVNGLQGAKGFKWQVEQDSFFAETQDSVWGYVFTRNGSFDILVEPILDSLYLGTQCNLNNRVTVYVDSVVADFEVDTSNLPRVCFTNTSINSVKNYWGFYHQTDITETGEPFKLSRETNEEEFCIDLPDSVGFYWTCLIAESPENCLDTVCKLIRYYAEQKLYIPNVFTPGSDRLNDFFMIDIEGHDFYELRIYNRWGDIVFDSEDKSHQWNGHVYNGDRECSDGTYIYQFRYRFERSDEIDKVSGIITLIREKRE